MTGAEFKAKRLKLEMTQKALAEKLGFTSTFIGMMERGEKSVRTVTQHAMWCLMYQSKVAKIGDRK